MHSWFWIWPVDSSLTNDLKPQAPNDIVHHRLVVPSCLQPPENIRKIYIYIQICIVFKRISSCVLFSTTFPVFCCPACCCFWYSSFVLTCLFFFHRTQTNTFAISLHPYSFECKHNLCPDWLLSLLCGWINEFPPYSFTPKLFWWYFCRDFSGAHILILTKSWRCCPQTAVQPLGPKEKQQDAKQRAKFDLTDWMDSVNEQQTLRWFMD